MSDDESAIRKSVAVLANFFVGDANLADTLTLIVDLTCQGVVRADMVGIARRVDGHIRTVAFSDDEMPEIDAIQYTTGGPGVDALVNRAAYRIESTTDDRIWPAFSAQAAAHGIVSTLSLPLMSRDKALGALSLYSRAGMLGAHDEGLSMVFAAQMAMALAHWDARARGEQLEEAMRSRAVIEQAKGVLMARGGLSPDGGFQILVRVSKDENRKLRDIAAEIVRGAQTGSPLDDTPPPTRNRP